MTTHALRGATLSLLLLFASAGAAFAQGSSDISKGSISVEVLDPSGAIIQNATVILSGPAGQQKATTDLRGQAVFLNLIPGQYKVRVEQAGFRAYETANLQVQAGQRSPVSAQLEPGAVTETVQVTDTAARVDTTTTTTGSTINQDTFTNLPIGRNVVNLFALSPGVVSSGDPVLGASNPSISGSTGLENQYVIDGINTTDPGYGAFGVFSNVYGSLGTGVNFDFVREVQLKTGGFEAQYGQALGGVVNIVTASGTNAVHGAVYGYMSPTWAEGSYRQPNAGGFEGFAPRISQPQNEVHSRNNRDIGFNLGGPFVQNRFFWYGSFNPSWNVVERMAPVNFGARSFGFIETKTRAYNWIGKLNYNITDNHHIEATAFGDPSRQPTSVLGGEGTLGHSLLRDDLNNASKTVYGSRNWAVKYNGLLGPSTVLAASFGWNRAYFDETPAFNLFSVRNYGKPKPNAAYTWEGGLDYIENTEGDNRQYTTMLTRNVNAFGGHQIDVGYMYNDVDYNAWRGYSGPTWPVPAAAGVRPGDVGKLTTGARFYLYPTRTAKQMGLTGVPPTQVFNNVYRIVRGNFSDPRVGTNTKYHAAFVQDAWQINRFVTAKLGVRWEEQKLKGEVSRYTFAGNWAPRLGFIIDPTGSRKTKIFANWGRFFERIPQDLAVRSMSQESDYRNIYSFGVPQTTANLVPGTVATPGGLNPTIIYGGTKSMYQEEIAAGVEREFGRGLVLSARFIHRDLKRILEDISGVTVEANLAGIDQQYVIANPNAHLDIFNNPQACDVGTPNCNPETGFTYNSGFLGPDGQVDLFPDARRVYKAMEITAEKRFGNNWSMMANYRLAKLFGNYEGLFRNDNGQADPNISSLFDFIYSPALADQFRVGVLPTDRRHVANIYGNYLFRGRLNIGAGWQINSGTPISGFLAHPAYVNQGEIPKGGRGAYGRTPTQNYFDLRLDYQHPISERVRVKLGSNLFNLFNRKTITAIDQNIELDAAIPNEDFLKPLRVHRPFYASFNVRLEF